MNRIEPERWVTLKYFMRTHFPDGSLKDHPEERFRFIYGVERQVPTLEAALEGTGLGAKSRITIPASEIYGEYDPELVREIPKKGLIKQRLKEGQFYRQMKKGCLVSFKVIEVRPETVLVDFNRPMAGIKVSMELEVMEIKEAKKGEINAAVDAQVKREIGCG